MRKLLPLLVIVLLTSACKEDKATVAENNNAVTTPAKPSIAKKPTAIIKDKADQIENAQTKQATEVADNKKAPMSQAKASTTVKVKQPQTSSSNIRIAEPVVKSAAPAVHNGLSVTTHKAPEKLEDDYPFNVDLKTVDGRLVKSADVFKKNGKPTVLLFWLSTCRPCHQKMEAIKPLYPEWKEEADFNVFAISGDFPQNYPSFVKQVKQKEWEWDTYNDVNRSFRDILPGGLNGYPQTFIFDKNGNLVYQDKKFQSGDEVKLFEKIKQVSHS